MKDPESMTDEADLERGALRGGGGRPSEARRRDGVGPVALLLPVAFALLTFALLRERLTREQDGPRAKPPTAEAFFEVAGWVGELAASPAPAVENEEFPGGANTVPSEEALAVTGGNGARLIASLRPLQSLPERQAFDAASLRKRLGLDEGEPWRLELRFSEPREEAKLQPLAVRNFAEITVFDEHGPALTPLTPLAGEGEVKDPLRILCSAPEVPLRPGYELTLFLWGRRPEGSLWLEGLAGGPFEQSHTMKLIPRSLPAQPLHESLAKLERSTKR